MNEVKLDVNGFLDATSLKSGDKNNKASSKISLGTSFKELLGSNVQLINSKSENTEEMPTEFAKTIKEDNLLLQLTSKDNFFQELQNNLSEGNSLSLEDIKKLELLSKVSNGKSVLESGNRPILENTDKLNKEINKIMSDTINLSEKSSSVDLVQNLVDTNTDKITQSLKKLVNLETKTDNLIEKISDKLGSDIESKTLNKVSKAETDIDSKNIDKSSNTSLDESVNLNNSLNNIMQLFNVNNKIKDISKAISTKDNESINDSIKKLVNLKNEIHREIQLLTNEVRPIIDRIQLSSNMSLESVPKEFSDNSIQLMNSKSEIIEKMVNELGKVTEDDNSLLQLISKDNFIQDLQKKLLEGNSLSSKDIEKLELLSKLSERKSSLELSNKGDVKSIDNLNKHINKVTSNTINFTEKSSSVDLVQNLVSTNRDKITEILKKLVDLETKIHSLIGSNKSASELESTDFLHALLSKGHSDRVISIKASKDVDNENSTSVNLADKLSNMDSSEKLVIKDTDEAFKKLGKFINLEKEVDNLIKKISDKVGLHIESKISKLSSIKSSLELSNKVEMESIDKRNKEIDKVIENIVNLSDESSSVNLVQNLVYKDTDKITEVMKKLVDLETKIDILIGNKSDKSASKLDSTDFLHAVLSKGHSDEVISDKASIAVDNKHKYSTSVNLIDRLPNKNFQEKVVVEDINKAPKNLKNLIGLKKEVDNLIEKISNKVGLHIESKISNKASKTETNIVSRNIDKFSDTSLTESVTINNSLNNIMQLFNGNNKIEDITKAIYSIDNEGVNDSIKKLVNLKNEIHREIQLLTNEVRPIIDRIQLSSNMSLETMPKEFSENSIQLMNSKSEITEEMFKEFGKVTKDDNSLLQLISKDNSIQDLQKKLLEGNSLFTEDIEKINLLSKLSERKSSLELSNKSNLESIDNLNKDINKVMLNTISISDKSSSMDLIQKLDDANAGEVVGKLKKLVNLENKIDKLIENIYSLNRMSNKDNSYTNNSTQYNNFNNNLLMQSLQQEHQKNINKKVPAGENLIENKVFDNSLKGNQLKGPIVNDEVNLLSNKNQHRSEFKNNNSFNSENKFLKGLLEDNKDIKFDKINTLMGQLIVQNQNDSHEIVHAPKVIDKSNFTSDIIKSISYMETKDIKNMIVKINPKELGEIYVKITATADGIMKANISANSRETFNLLNAHVQDLNNNLSNCLIKIHNIDISIYNGNTAFFSNSSNENQNSENNSKYNNYSVSNIDSEEGDTLPKNTVYEDNKLNILV